MRILFSLIFICLICDAEAQTKKQLKQHKLSVAASRKNQTPLMSLDSFYCSGLKLSMVKDRDAGMNNIVFRHLKTNDTMIFVSLMNNGDSISPVLCYHFEFPALRSGCDIMVNAATPELPLSNICKQGLLNSAGLDTFRAETFVSLKGTYAKKRDAQANFKMPVRNRYNEITVRGHDIYQDSVIIGSFDETTIPGLKGVSLKQIQVYNTQKQVVCFSTETSPEKHDWRTVTNKDGKYHIINTTKSREGDLYEIIRFLIANEYL